MSARWSRPGIAFAGFGPALQVAGFVAASTGLLLFVRPPVKAALDRAAAPSAPTPGCCRARAPSWCSGSPTSRARSRLNGELWRARPYAGTGPVDVGKPVSVAAVEGATLLIYSSDLS